MILYRKVSVVRDYLTNVTSEHEIFHTQSHLHVPGVWDHSRVLMHLFAGLCKLGTTFCVNFEQQKCKISVYSSKSKNTFHFQFEEQKSVDFA